VPEWAQKYQEFWDSIRKRNLWFIKLRYVAVTMMAAFLLISISLLDVQYSKIQLLAISSITAIILLYNIVLQKVRKDLKCEPGKFNPLYFSLLQMVLDFIALLLLVYFTGGIESPFYILFVFHMIIGSLILPGTVIYTIAIVFVLVFALIVFMEMFGIIPHHQIVGLLGFSLHTNPYFIATFLTAFAFMIFISVYLTNGIAKQLYNRERELLFTKLKLLLLQLHLISI
jgi:hypothetical protein